MSNDLQIIYVTFPSIIVFAEDINCVTNIKLSAKRAELSFLLSENAEPSAARQTCIWPSFVQHLTQCEGFLLEMPTWVADDVCVSSVLWLPGPCRCAALSPHQFHKLQSKVCEAFAAIWLLTRTEVEASWCEYPTPDFVPIRVKVWPAEISVGRDLGLKNGNLKTGMNIFW